MAIEDQNTPERAASFTADFPEVLKAFNHDGYFVGPGLLTAAECDTLIAAAQNLESARNGSLLPVMQVHQVEPLFYKTFGHPKIISIMDQLCGGRVVGIQTQFYFTPPERAGLGFHQDNYFVEAPNDSFASAWIPLVDVEKSNGGLYAFPGTQTCGKLPVQKINTTGKDKRETVYEETVLPPGFQKVDLSAKRGSVVFIHGYLVHGSYQNHSQSNRYVILNTYVREGVPFRSGLTAKREEVKFDRR